MRKTLLAAGLLAAGLAVADETAAPIVVTATRTAETADETLAAVTVITREDVERSQVRSLQELLAGLPGIGIANSGGDGKATSLYLRGTESDHVLVLVDGVQVGSATLGTAAFEQIPVDEIERIEIVRGPRSALYGSEAIGGVIQIFTRRGGVARTTAWIGGGSRGTARAGASLSGGGTEAWYALGVSGLITDGIDARRDSETDEDGFRTTSASLRIGRRIGPAEVELTWLRATGESDYDGSWTNGSDTLQEVLRLETRIERGEALWTVRLGRARDESDNTLNGAFVSRFDTWRESASVQVDLPAGEGLLTVGVDWTDDRVDGTTAYTVTSRADTGLFLQYQTPVAAGDLEVALRGDDDEQFGSHVTGGIAWGRTLASGLRLVASWGTAFKAPTFNELYYPGYGNPGLDPERSHSLEFGLRGGRGDATWAVTLFATEIHDLIEAVLVTPPYTYEARNVGDARIVGLEMEGGLRLGGWRLRGALTLQDPENRGETYRGKRLPRRAAAMLRLGAERDFGRWTAGAVLRGEGTRYNDAANTQRMDAYAVVDLRGEYRISRSLRLQGRIENALDEDYETAAGYNQPGRGFFLTLRYERPRG